MEQVCLCQVKWFLKATQIGNNIETPAKDDTVKNILNF